MQHVVVAPIMPRRFVPETVQVGADCLAWQMFIYLNWKASPVRAGAPSNAPASTFGRPGDTSPTVWQSFPEASAVFAEPGRTKQAAASRDARAHAGLTLSGGEPLTLSDTKQSGGGWLTAQSGSPVYYEVRVNPDEAEYIRDNNLTTFAGQAACVQKKGGFNLPHGNVTLDPETPHDVDCAGNPHTYGLDVGAIEIKASWIVLPQDGSLDYRFKTARALVTDPTTGTQREATVGLVGLHIIRKMPGAAQFVWATFEQIDNVPDAADTTKRVLPANGPERAGEVGYTFYNPTCSAATDPYGCVANRPPGTACVAGKTLPGCHPITQPTQTTRLTKISLDVNEATADAWGAIRKQLAPGAPTSVFNYYRLIDVVWPAQDIPPVPPTAKIPLRDDNMMPILDTRFVANTTMETYVQQKESCMDCHVNAAIAQPPLGGSRSLSAANIRAIVKGQSTRPVAPDGGATPGASLYASDFSFVFAAESRR